MPQRSDAVSASPHECVTDQGSCPKVAVRTPSTPHCLYYWSESLDCSVDKMAARLHEHERRR